MNYSQTCLLQFLVERSQFQEPCGSFRYNFAELSYAAKFFLERGGFLKTDFVQSFFNCTVMKINI